MFQKSPFAPTLTPAPTLTQTPSLSPTLTAQPTAQHKYTDPSCCSGKKNEGWRNATLENYTSTAKSAAVKKYPSWTALVNAGVLPGTLAVLLGLPGLDFQSSLPFRIPAFMELPAVDAAASVGCAAHRSCSMVVERATNNGSAVVPTNSWTTGPVFLCVESADDQNVFGYTGKKL